MKVDAAYAWAHTREGVRAARALMDKPRMIENRLVVCYARLDVLKDKLPPSYRLRPDPARTGPGDKTGSLAARIADLEREIEGLLQELVRVQAARKMLINDIPDQELRQALTYMYLDGLTSVAAAGRMYIEERQYFRKVQKGLSQVAMRMAMEETCADEEKMV